VVFRRDAEGTRVLLIRDPYDQWGLPKGHIETGETASAAALREIGEETGLTDLRLGEPLPTIDWYFRADGRLVHKFCHFFLVEAPHGDPRPRREEGISDCRWTSLEEALDRVSYDNAREVLRDAVNRLTAVTG
jgi:8-oxo-dGTP pyrophosphatase MutT (NUDIX family)